MSDRKFKVGDRVRARDGEEFSDSVIYRISSIEDKLCCLSTLSYGYHIGNIPLNKLEMVEEETVQNHKFKVGDKVVIRYTVRELFDKPIGYGLSNDAIETKDRTWALEDELELADDKHAESEDAEPASREKEAEEMIEYLRKREMDEKEKIKNQKFKSGDSVVYKERNKDDFIIYTVHKVYIGENDDQLYAELFHNDKVGRFIFHTQSVNNIELYDPDINNSTDELDEIENQIDGYFASEESRSGQIYVDGEWVKLSDFMVAYKAYVKTHEKQKRTFIGVYNYAPLSMDDEISFFPKGRISHRDKLINRYYHSMVHRPDRNIQGWSIMQVYVISKLGYDVEIIGDGQEEFERLCKEMEE